MLATRTGRFGAMCEQGEKCQANLSMFDSFEVSSFAKVILIANSVGKSTQLSYVSKSKDTLIEND